ncbi:MAG TPA: hypothetical protein VI566_01620 [Xanthomonadales bacterium]|nr:hypothetical protein [Xanthomonadales bacterium]
MSQITIQLTRFQVEKLQCIGGAGHAAPYRVTTYQGMDLGAVGVVMDSNVDAANTADNDRKLGGFLLHGLCRLLGVV